MKARETVPVSLASTRVQVGTSTSEPVYLSGDLVARVLEIHQADAKHLLNPEHAAREVGSLARLLLALVDSQDECEIQDELIYIAGQLGRIERRLDAMRARDRDLGDSVRVEARP